MKLATFQAPEQPLVFVKVRASAAPPGDLILTGSPSGVGMAWTRRGS